MPVFTIGYVVVDFNGVHSVGKIDHKAENIELAQKNAMRLVLGEVEDNKDDDYEDPEGYINLKSIQVSVSRRS